MHKSLLEELQKIERSELLQSGSLRQLNTAYAKMNLDYIALCEKNPDLHYMPSSRSDGLMEKHQANGDSEKVQKVFRSRLQDIRRCLDHV